MGNRTESAERNVKSGRLSGVISPTHSVLMRVVLGCLLLSLSSEAICMHQLRRCIHSSRSRPWVMALSREDAESNERLVDALFGGVEEASKELVKDPNIASHLQLDLDENGQPKQLRFVYVDEAECIGCTYCADVARNTFMMHPDAGRARAYAQGQDDPEVIMEAIECCPVYVAATRTHNARSVRECSVPSARR